MASRRETIAAPNAFTTLLSSKGIAESTGNVTFRMPKGRRNKRYTKKGHGYIQPMNALAAVTAIPERR